MFIVKMKEEIYKDVKELKDVTCNIKNVKIHL